MHNRAPPFSCPQNPREQPGPEVEQCLSKLQESNSLKRTGPFPSPWLSAACVLSITVNITEQEVQGWEEVKHKPAAQCTCLAAACSDILGHGDLVERTDAHWCTGTRTWQLHKWLKQEKKSTNTEERESGDVCLCLCVCNLVDNGGKHNCGNKNTDDGWKHHDSEADYT